MRKYPAHLCSWMGEGEQAALWLQKPFNPPWFLCLGQEWWVLLSWMKNQAGQQCLSSSMVLTQPGATGVDTVL